MTQGKNRNTGEDNEHKTRSAIIASAIVCISEMGYQKASTNRIAQHAGLTWGVIQYHFGDKAGLLKAVLDSNFRQYPLLFARVEELANENDLDARVSSLVSLVWKEINSVNHRVTMDIIQHLQKDNSIAIDTASYLEQWSQSIGHAWNGLFPHARNSLAAKRLLFASLQGLADNPLAREYPDIYSNELKCLTDLIIYLITQAPETR